MPQQSSSQEGYVPLVERDADQVGGAGAPSIQRGVPGGVGGAGICVYSREGCSILARGQYMKKCVYSKYNLLNSSCQNIKKCVFTSSY